MCVIGRVKCAYMQMPGLPVQIHIGAFGEKCNGMEIIMIALRITNVRQFMGKLLGSEDFDSFLLEEASISTYNTFLIDGHQNREFYTAEEWDDETTRPYDLSTWKTMRPICFDLIKGTRTPIAFRFVLHLMPKYVASILRGKEAAVAPQQVKAFVLNIKYDGTDLTIVTGTAFHTFLMDKTPDVLWDQAVRQFLAKKDIIYEEL